MRWYPKTHQVVLLLVAVVAAPLVALGIWQGQRLDARAEVAAHDNLRNVAADVADDVSTAMAADLEQLERIAIRAADLESWTETDRLRGLFDGRYAPSGFNVLYLGDRWGTALFASPARSANGLSYAGINYADRAFFRRVRATDRAAVGDATMGRSHHNLTVGAAAPVFATDGSLRGVVAGSIQLGPMLAKLRDDAERGRVRIVLTDENDDLIADSARLTAPLTRWRPRWKDQAALRAAEPETGADLYQVAERVELPSTAWQIYTMTPVATATAASHDQHLANLVATALALAAMVLAIYTILRLAIRDLRRITAAARSIGDGDYCPDPREAPTLTPREVVSVWDSLNAAAAQLDARRAERNDLIRELQESNERMRTFATGVRDAKDGVLVLDGRHRVQYANDAWLTLHQVAAEEIEGKDIEDLKLSDDPKRLEMRAAVESGGEWRGTLRIKRRDGSVGEAEVSLSPVRGEDGAFERHVALVRDVTGRRQAELSLQQTERLASLGLLAAGVAHEINNPMTYVLGNLEELGELSQSGELTLAEGTGLDLNECLADCLHGSRRVIEIVRDLRQLSQLRTETAGATADVREVVESCLRVAHSQLRHCGEITRDFPDDPLPLSISEQHLGQIVLNLLVNAGQAMEPTRTSSNRLMVRARRLSRDRAELEITDSGSGMTPETLRKIFDPFFTTKRAGMGTGLGLSICRSLVTAAGGDISVESELNQGTTFRITLPVSQQAVAADSAPHEPLQDLDILVVDDEPNVRTSLQRLLAPCKTAGAGTVDEALELVAGRSFDVVLADVVMPERTGVDLLRELERRAPALARRTCLMSGGVLGADLATQVEELAVPFLYKPMSREELHRALLQVVRGAERTTALPPTTDGRPRPRSSVAHHPP